MSNTLEGRLYVMKDSALSREPFTGLTQAILVESPYIVQNGKWVLERFVLREGNRGWRWLVGAESDDIETVELESFPHGVRRLYVSKKPFGFVTADEEDVATLAGPMAVKSDGRKTLEYARQIHKGELSQGPRIPRLDYVRQPLEPTQKPSVTKARERRRGQFGWVQLADLGEVAVGYNLLDQLNLILGYWNYSGHNGWINGRRIGPLVDVAWGDANEIKDGEATFESLTRMQFLDLAFTDTSELWLRRGFAFTILRLQALGVEPEVP